MMQVEHVRPTPKRIPAGFRLSDSGLFVPREKTAERVRASGMGSIFGPTIAGFKAPSGGPAYSPLDEPTLLAWWDPNTTATSATWTDRTSNAYVLEQSTGASQPTKLTADSDLDGNDGFSFDGTNDFFELEMSGGGIPFGKFEWWIVKKSTTGARLWIRDDGASTIIGYGYQPGGPNGFVKDPSGNRSMVDATSFSANPSTVHIHRHRFDGHSQHIISNGGSDYTMSDVANESPATTSQSGKIWIGSYLGSSEFMTMKLGDIFLFSEPLAGASLTNMLAFVHAKYPSAP